jgi:hypothetical protein
MVVPGQSHYEGVMPNIRLVLRDITPGDYNAVLEVYRRSEDFCTAAESFSGHGSEDIGKCHDEGGVFQGVYNTNKKLLGM